MASGRNEADRILRALVFAQFAGGYQRMPPALHHVIKMAGFSPRHRAFHQLFFRLFPLVFCQVFFADADGFGRDFNQFVVVDKFQRLFQGVADRRGEDEVFVRAGGADVGQLFSFERVDGEVVVAAVDAYHHAFVDFVAVADEEAPPVLQVEERVGERLAGRHRDEDAVVSRFAEAVFFRAVVVEGLEFEAAAGGEGHEFGLETDEAARRDEVFEADAAFAVRHHVAQFAFALAHALHHRPLVLFVQIQDDEFVGFVNFAINFFVDDFRARHAQFVAFTPHGFDEDGEVQFATAAHFEFVRVVHFFDAQGDVVDEFAVKALLDLAAGDVFAFAPGKGRVVYLEGHAHRRLIDGEAGQRFDVVRVAEGVGDVERVDAGEGDDVAGGGAIDFDFFEAEEFEDLQDAATAHRAIAANDFYRGVAADAAALNAADADDAGVAGVVERGDLHSERRVAIHVGWRYVGDDGFKERGHVATADVGVVARVAVQAGGVNYREIKLFVGGAEAVEEVEGFVQYPVGARAGAVDFVDDDDGVQSHVEGFLGDEAGLRHRPVHRVNQQQHAVHHGEDALDFAAKVGVSGGVNDVDLVVFPTDCGVFRHDGDAAFAFEVH